MISAMLQEREHQQPCGLHQFHMPAVPSPWELSAFLPHSSLQYRPSTINTNIMPWYFPLLPHPGIGFTLESTVLFSPAFSASFWSPKPSAIIASGKSAGWHLYPPCPSYCISPNQCNFSKIQGHLHTDPILRILQTLQECARLNIYHHKFPVTIHNHSLNPVSFQLADDPMTPHSRLLPPLTLKGFMKKCKHYLMLIRIGWLIFSLYLILSAHSLGDIINEWMSIQICIPTRSSVLRDILCSV